MKKRDTRTSRLLYARIQALKSDLWHDDPLDDYPPEISDLEALAQAAEALECLVNEFFAYPTSPLAPVTEKRALLASITTYAAHLDQQLRERWPDNG